MLAVAALALVLSDPKLINGRWYDLGRGTGGDRWLLDINSMPAEPSRVMTLWFKIQYSKTKPLSSELLRVVIDCDHDTIQRLESLRYRTVRGAPTEQRYYEQPEAPAPETWGEHVMNVMCEPFK